MPLFNQLFSKKNLLFRGIFPVCAHCTTEKHLAFSSLPPPFGCLLYTLAIFPLSLLFSRLCCPSSPSFFSPMKYVSVPQPSLWPFVDMDIPTTSSMSIFLTLRTPNPHSRCLVSPLPYKGEGSPPSTSWQYLSGKPSSPFTTLAGKVHTLLDHVQFAVHQDPQVLFCQAASQLGCPHKSWCMGLFFLSCRTLHLSLLNFMGFLSDHFFQPVKIPLDSSMTLWCTSHSSSFVSSADLLKPLLIIETLNTGVKQGWTLRVLLPLASYWTLWSPLSGLAIWTALNPSHALLIQPRHPVWLAGSHGRHCQWTQWSPGRQNPLPSPPLPGQL